MVRRYDRRTARKKRHYRLRRHLSGTEARPRLAVFRSNKHIYAQLIDDAKGNTITASSTVEKGLIEGKKSTSNIEAAKIIGADIAKKAADKGINAVVFDRSGFLFHGKIKALADAAREAGLNF
jgi:large subunit ribosomal protein L18